MTEASIGKDVARARVMLTNLPTTKEGRPREQSCAEMWTPYWGGTPYIAPIGAGSPVPMQPSTLIDRRIVA